MVDPNTTVDPNNAFNTWGGLALTLASPSFSMPWHTTILCLWASHSSAAELGQILTAPPARLDDLSGIFPANNTGAVFTLVCEEALASLAPPLLSPKTLPVVLKSLMWSCTSLGIL